MTDDQKQTSIADEQNDFVVDGDEPQSEVDELKLQVQKAQESERRALADYQNLIRRTQEDRVRMVKMAAHDVIESILQPLDHLYLAQAQLKDKGLDMVVQQFQRALQEHGLAEIVCEGKDFDPHTMEVVGKEAAKEKKQINKVMKVHQKGYTLNGDVLRHAKVIIGEE